MSQINRRMALTALVGAAGVHAEQRPLRIATGEFPPFVDSKAADFGVVSRRVAAAFAHSGHAVEFVFMPWARALARTRLGEFDATSFWYGDSSREADFFHSAPVAVNDLRWLVLRDNPIKRRSRVGLVNSYTYSPSVRAVIATQELSTQPLFSDESGVRMLLLGRIDTLPMDVSNACDLLQAKFTREEMARLTLDPGGPLDRRIGHVLLPRRLSRSKELLDALNQGLTAVLGRRGVEDMAPSCPNLG